MIEVYIDGLCEPRNPGGTAAYGFVVFRDGGKLHEEGKVVGSGPAMSNNVAEYSAVAASMRWLIGHRLTRGEIVFKTDSQLVAHQMPGFWSVRGGLYVDKYAEAQYLAREFSDAEFMWVPREQNFVADELSRKAYEEWCFGRGMQPKYHRQYEKNEGWAADRGCWVCRWSRLSGPHLGCYYGGRYNRWVPRRLAGLGCGNFEKSESLGVKTS